MRRFVLDTILYIEAACDRAKAEELAQFSSAFLPSLYLHAVVVQELLAGAVSAAGRREMERGLVGPFERRGRIIVLGYRAWKRSGEIAAELIARKMIAPGGMSRSYMNDVVLAASCKESGSILVTRNIHDFERIGTVADLNVVEPWPAK